MYSENCEIKSWIVAKIKPNKDEIAITNLSRQNFEVFQPKFNTISKERNKFKEVTKTVFLSYIFIAVNLEEKNWHKINNTRGISRIIAFGNKVPIIHNKLIDDTFQVGMNAEVKNGPFAELSGKIDAIDSDKRIWILLDILGTQTRVSIDKFKVTAKEQTIL